MASKRLGVVVDANFSIAAVGAHARKQGADAPPALNGGAGAIRPATSPGPLSADQLQKMNAYWRAANYLSVGQIYLKDNPLLETPLKLEHIKPRLLGHWGTTPGLNFLYVHLNRLIKDNDLNITDSITRSG